MQEVENSLRRLGTDWIDLYQVHRPEPETDIEETLSALSRSRPPGQGALHRLLHLPGVRGRGGPVGGRATAACSGSCASSRPTRCSCGASRQDLLPTTLRHGMGVIPWSPLAGGWLSGGWRKGQDPPSSTRAQRLPARYDLSIEANQRKLEAADALAGLADESGISLIHLALAFVIRHPAVTAAIIGPRTMEQLESQLGAEQVELSDGGARPDRRDRAAGAQRQPRRRRLAEPGARAGGAEAMSTPPSGRQFELSSGQQRAVVVEVGGGIREYSVAGRDVLEPYALDQMCDAAHGAPLIPWPNRLADGRYSFGGAEHQLALERARARKRDPRAAPLAAVDRARARDRPRAPRSAAARDARLPLLARGVDRLRARRGGPHGHDRGAQRRSRRSAPSARASTPTCRRAELRSTTARCTCRPPRGCSPTSARSRSGASPWRAVPTTTRTPRPVGELQIDDAFTDLARDGDGLARARLECPDGAAVELWADERYPFLEVFSGDPLPEPRRRRALAVEPMSCAPNAFRSGDGLVRLAPGEDIVLRWGAGLRQTRLVAERQVLRQRDLLGRAALPLFLPRAPRSPVAPLVLARASEGQQQQPAHGRRSRAACGPRERRGPARCVRARARRPRARASARPRARGTPPPGGRGGGRGPAGPAPA